MFVVPPLFGSDFTNLGLFPPHFSQISQGLVNLTYFFKEPAFYFVDSLYVFFFVPISLISAIIFIISLLLHVFGYACSSFSRSLDVALGHLFDIFLSF
jgi:hypothetical protein